MRYSRFVNCFKVPSVIDSAISGTLTIVSAVEFKVRSELTANAETMTHHNDEFVACLKGTI